MYPSTAYSNFRMDVQSLLAQLAEAVKNQTIKIELHHYHHTVPAAPVTSVPPVKVAPDVTYTRGPTPTLVSSTGPIKTPCTVEEAMERFNLTLLYGKEYERTKLSKFIRNLDASTDAPEKTTTAMIDSSEETDLDIEYQIKEQLLKGVKEDPDYEAELQKLVSNAGGAKALLEMMSKQKKEPVPHKEFMSATELTDVLDDMVDGFDMSSYIAQKRLAGLTCVKSPPTNSPSAKLPIVKNSSRANNVDDGVMEEFFDQNMGNDKPSKPKDPEPTSLTPMLRYRKKDQQRIQMEIYKSSKAFVVGCYPDQTLDELDDKIREEADKRLEAWNAKHYK